MFSRKERSHKKELIWSLLKRSHSEEDSWQRKDPNQQGLCRVCVESQAWEQLRKQLPGDKHRAHGGDCLLRSQRDTLQKIHKRTS